MHKHILNPSIVLPIKDDLVSVYMVVVNLRLNAIHDTPHLFQKGHTLLLLIKIVLMHCRTMEPSEVADLLRSKLSDEIDILKIGTVLTSYLWVKDNKSSQSRTLFAQRRR